MRVSSSAPAMSRRSILRGLAVAFVGASVPAAALFGRELAHRDDAELLGRCRQWKEQTRKLKRIEKRLRVYAADARSRTPELAPAFYAPIQIKEGVVRVPYNGLGPKDGPWARERLAFYAEERSFNSNITPFVGPTPECQAHCRNLLKLLDKHEKAIKRAWAPHSRLDRQYEREVGRRAALFRRIIRTKAKTLQGAMAQLELVEADRFLIDGHHQQANEALLGVMRNARRLVSAQSAEA